MKKIFLSLGALLVFGIASAQTDPQQIKPKDPVKNNMEQKDKAKTDANMQSDVNKSTNGDMVQPRKDELKTRDHVKSTPDRVMKDTTTTKAAKKPRKVRKA